MKIPVNWDLIEDAPLFNLTGLKTEAKVVDVYDGDTIKVVFMFANKMYKWRVRFLRINAPEVRGTNKEKGIGVRDTLRSWILGKVITVECHKFDGFGRLLSEIYLNDENIFVFVFNVYSWRCTSCVVQFSCPFRNFCLFNICRRHIHASTLPS